MESWETDWNRDVLERIVALLFALAGLADRAAGAPFLRRRRVLGILSHGEAEARAFLFGAGAPVPADAAAGDAARLAIRLRALALVLCVMLSQAATFAPPGGRSASRSGEEACRPGRTPGGAVRPRHVVSPALRPARQDIRIAITRKGGLLRGPLFASLRSASLSP